MSSFQSINPYNNQVIATYRADSKNAVNEKINRSHQTQMDWYALPLKKRGQYLKKFAAGLMKNKKQLATLAAMEMGKPLKQGIAEVEKCAKSILYYVENASQFLQPLQIPTEAKKSYISFQPLGVVLAIMPWNFPFWQACRAIGPILMAGNTFLLKHASNVMGCALEMKKIWDEAGLPTDVFQVVKVAGAAMEAVIAHPKIAAITFTGSSAAGAMVAATAAKHLKKQVLELGGSDPYLILEDADIDLAVAKCATSRLNNSGQSCIAAKRFIVDAKIVAEFEEKLKATFETYTLGDPMDSATKIGPQARQDLRDELHQQVLKSKKKGAKILMGGVITEGDHAFYPATILSGVKKGMPAYDEEMFGPVASIIIVEDVEEAIAVANDTIYGLGGAIFSRDVAQAEAIANTAIQAGFVAINDYVSSDPRLPFGGIKQSGYGRELSHLGMMEFCNQKTIFVR